MASAKIKGPSTKNLDKMPDPETLWKRCVSLALVERTIGSEHPHYTLDMEWPQGPIFRRDNGAGDRYAIAFVARGVFVRGFDHASKMSPSASADGKTIWPGMYAAVPRTLEPLITEPHLERDPLAITFCMTHGRALARWAIGVKGFPRDDEMPGDGSRWMLRSLTEDARGYVDWAKDYYDRAIPLEPVQTLFGHGHLEETLLRKINPQANVAEVLALAAAARYGKAGVPPFS